MLVAGIGGSGVVTVSQTLAVAAYLDGLFSSNLDLTGLSQKYGAVTSHVRIARDARRPARDPHRRGRSRRDDRLRPHRRRGRRMRVETQPGSRAVISADLTPTADFARNPNWSVDADALIERLKSALGDNAFVLDAQRLAEELLGDPIASNMFMLGAAWQKGLVPIRRRRSIGRSSSTASRSRPTSRPSNGAGARRTIWPASRRSSPPTSRPRAPSLDALIERRVAHLTDYRDAAYAARYSALVERVRAAEKKAGLGEALTFAVARAYHKLIAVKDEWEVARLFAAPEFQRGARARVRRPLSPAFPYRRLAVRPARPADRGHEQGRGGPLGDDRLPRDGAAQVPARHVARSVPLERRAQARAPAPRRIRGRRRGSHRAPYAGDPLARRSRRRPYETIRGYGRVKEASAAEAARARANALHQLKAAEAPTAKAA